MTTLPVCDLSHLAFQIDVLAAGDDERARAIATQFLSSTDPGWFEKRRARFQQILKLNPDLEPRARSIATSWFGLRNDYTNDATGPTSSGVRAASPDKTPEAYATSSYGSPDNVDLEHGLLRHLMTQLGASRAFLGLLSPISNQFEISVSIPHFPEKLLGRDSSNKSLIGLVTNWKCPYFAPDVERSRGELHGWWKPTPEWGTANSVLCVPLLILNYWPDGTPFPYPIGSLYFEHEDKSHFGEEHLVLMTLVSSIVAPWLLSYRRALGLATFRAAARFARNDPPRDWPTTLSLELGRALNELRTANCAFVLRSGVYSEQEKTRPELRPAIDALVGVDNLQEVEAEQLLRLRDVFQSRGDKSASHTDEQVLRDCRDLASVLKLATRPGTTRKARELAFSGHSAKSAHATWDCAADHNDSVPFFKNVASTVSIASYYRGNTGNERLLVSLTAECSAVRFDDHAGRIEPKELTLDELRQVGAQGWLREPYFFRFEDTQYLYGVAAKLSEFVQRRHLGSGYQRAAFFDFVPLTAELAQRIELTVRLAFSVTQERKRTPVILVRGQEGDGKSALAYAVHRDAKLLGNATEPVVLTRQLRSPIVASQACHRATAGREHAACVALVDNADQLNDAALDNLLQILTDPSALPGAVLVITYAREHTESTNPMPDPSVLDLLGSMRSVDPSSSNRAQLKAMLESTTVEVLDLPRLSSLTEEDRVEVARLCVEIEKDAYSTRWNPSESTPFVALAEGPSEVALRAMMSYKEAARDVASLREFARRWILLSALKQGGHVHTSAIRRVHLDGQDLGTVLRVLNGGSIYFEQDFQHELDVLERAVFPDANRQDRRTAALRWVFRALVHLHHEQPHSTGFAQSEIEAVVRKRCTDSELPAKNAFKRALTEDAPKLTATDGTNVIVPSGNTNDRMYSLGTSTLKRLGLGRVGTDAPSIAD